MAETTFAGRKAPRWKKLLFAIVVIAVGAFAFLTWYKFHYSMDVAEAFEISIEDPENRVLIATQGSDFKNAVVAGVVEALKGRQIFIKGVDVSALNSVNVDDWNAVVILHTWENWKPQADAKAFLERQTDRDKVVVLTTSGDGDLRMDGVDAISSASRMSDVPTRVSEILHRIDTVIGEKG